MRNILNRIARQARMTLGDTRAGEIAASLDPGADPDGVLEEFLTLWCEADARPVVLLLDEIDALVGDSLIAVLRQLRSGYLERPRRFPQSVVLCGVRDVRDYRIHSSREKQVIAGGSAFNIKARSLRLGDFAETEVRALLGQHTAETGQEFAPGSARRGVAPDPRPAVPGQRAGQGNVLRVRADPPSRPAACGA